MKRRESRGGEPISSAYVYVNLFDLLGAQPMLGRGFLPEEEKRGASVVVLSHSLWQRRFGSDPGLVGKSLTLNGRNFTVVGVMPAGFDFPRPELGFGADRREIWQPLQTSSCMSCHQGFNARGRDFVGMLGSFR